MKFDRGISVPNVDNSGGRAACVSLGDFLYAMLNWPTDDWREQLNRFVEHTRYYGLIIEPESVRAIHDLIEARVNGTGPFAVLGPYGGPQPAGTGPTVQLAMSVGLDESSATDATVTTDSGQSIATADGTGVVDAAPVPRAQAESRDVDQPFVISVIPDVSGPGPKDLAAKTDSPPVVATKPHLPADSRGTWIIGEKGNGVFRYNNSAQNQEAGVAGKEVRYRNQHIAIGGFPADAYYGGSAASATVEIEKVTATNADNVAADAKMRKKLSDPNWQRPEGYRWNHAGEPRSKTMELVDAKFHGAVAHKGPAAEVRALRRAANARGGIGKGGKGRAATGRVFAALTVYLTARDALQAAGILEPDYVVTQRADYYYVANDGSVFIVYPSWLFWSAKRVFVAGPRKGQTEKLSKKQVEQYRKIAEAKWGKYIPGTIFREPRFIPGTHRKTLRFIDYEHGDTGWIDETGVHRGLR